MKRVSWIGLAMKPPSARFWLLIGLAVPQLACGAISVTAPADETYAVNNSTTITVGADPNAATTTATLDGQPFPIGQATLVNTYGFHELLAESRTAGGTLVEAVQHRFIIVDPARNGTENGLPRHTPYRMVNDAPSAFAGGVLQVVAPASWPLDLPVPVAFRLLKDAAAPGNPPELEGLRLNGIVTASNFPGVAVQLRRGWGSGIARAPTVAGATTINADCNGVTTDRPLNIEATTTWQTLSGTVGSNTYPANSRIHLTGDLTISAAATLTIGAGSIVKCAPGVTINVQGTLNLNGTLAEPVVVAPADFAQPWGGFHLNNGASSRVFAYASIFVRSGADPTWFNTVGTGFDTHRKEQATFAVGANAGAQLTLEDCFLFDLAGQAFAGDNGTLNIKRSLVQRCTSGGEIHGSTSTSSIVNIDRSAIIEIPSETAQFVDGDNDGIYLTGGQHNLTRTVIGWTKDDGVDSGANGAVGTVTTMTGNWYESIYHEGNSISGIRTINFDGCVFFNCGQGPEVGYSGSTSNGAITTVTNTLLTANMVGLRFGDNYDWDYFGRLTARRNISIHNFFQDVWGYEWNSFTYRTDRMTIGDESPAHDQPIERNYFTTANARHPFNNVFNPGTDGARLAPFMPVPDSNVGIAVHTWNPQDSPANYTGLFQIRLSTFSSRPVAAGYRVLAKLAPEASESTVIAGDVSFAPGETLKTVTVPIAGPGAYHSIRITLEDPENAEVTGEAFFITPPGGVGDIAYVPRGGGAWRYREARSEPPATWKTLAFDDSSPAATEWLPATLPAGFPSGGLIVTAVEDGPDNDRTKAYYFRKKFTVADPQQIKSVVFRVRRDDAAVAWLNNDATPIAVSAEGNFPGPYTYAMTGVPNASNTGYIEYAVPPSKLVQGENILAVEVHQTTLTSSDLFIDCELIATPQPPLVLNYTMSNGTPLLWWFDPNAVLERSSNLQQWRPVPVAGSPLSIPEIGAKEFFRLRR
jgi:hypothetical protein